MKCAKYDHSHLHFFLVFFLTHLRNCLGRVGRSRNYGIGECDLGVRMPTIRAFVLGNSDFWLNLHKMAHLWAKKWTNIRLMYHWENRFTPGIARLGVVNKVLPVKFGLGFL